MADVHLTVVCSYPKLGRLAIKPHPTLQLCIPSPSDHQGKYLVASPDRVSVSQDRDPSESAIWTVECVNHNTQIRLKSFYKLYLSASDTAFLLGMTGKKVLQTVATDHSVEWTPFEEGSSIKLFTRYGNCLRGNGGPPPWRNSVTHDVPVASATKNLILWSVEIVEYKTENLQDTELSKKRMSDGRTVFYALASDNGELPNGTEWHKITFKGNTLKELGEALKKHANVNESIILCYKHHVNGKIYHLQNELPANNTSMRVVIVKSSSTAARNLLLH